MCEISLVFIVGYVLFSHTPQIACYDNKICEQSSKKFLLEEHKNIILHELV